MLPFEPLAPVPSTPLLESAIRADYRHCAGALLGLAVGDALGATLEFQVVDGPPFPQLCTGPHRDLAGGGPFHVAPGQVTDDTQMAVCLFESLLAREDFDQSDLIRRYLAWRREAFDVGGQIRAALDLGTPDAGRIIWDRGGRQAAGNGALMRTSPIGILFCADPDRRRQVTFDDGAMTHFDPRSQLACAALNAAISHGVLIGESRSVDDIAFAARAEIDVAERALAERYRDLEDLIAAAAMDVRDDLSLASADDPVLYGPAIDLRQRQGFVRIAFRLAFWELLHTRSFEEALVDVANRGGDADTNAAVTGALLGAFYGVDAIPDRWLSALLKATPGDPRSMVRQLHPVQFVTGLERLHERASSFERRLDQG